MGHMAFLKKPSGSKYSKGRELYPETLDPDRAGPGARRGPWRAASGSFQGLLPPQKESLVFYWLLQAWPAAFITAASAQHRPGARALRTFNERKE